MRGRATGAVRSSGTLRAALRGKHPASRSAPNTPRHPGPAAPPCPRPGEPPPQPPPESQPLAGPAGQQIDLSQIPIEFEEPSVTAARSEAAGAGAGGDAVTAGSVNTTATAPVTAAAPVVAQSLVEYVTAQARQSETAPRRKTTITVEQYREMQMKKRVSGNRGLCLSIVTGGLSIVACSHSMRAGLLSFLR